MEGRYPHSSGALLLWRGAGAKEAGGTEEVGEAERVGRAQQAEGAGQSNTNKLYIYQLDIELSTPIDRSQ